MLLLTIVGGLLVAWHGSLQHEIIHGHPSTSRWWNELFASLPLGLWLPFRIYREQHETHHRSQALTDPHEDPESFYVSAERWAGFGALRRALARSQTTLVGRLVLGPLVTVARFFVAEARAIAHGDLRHLRAWAIHLVGVVVVLAWLSFCKLPLWVYLACFVYPGLACTLLRSFAEHRPSPIAAHRIGIVEAGPLARLLFLNNNLHVVHHDAPGLPWYELPRHYQERRAAILERNGGFLFHGYFAVAARFAVRSKDSPVHPHPAQPNVEHAS